MSRNLKIQISEIIIFENFCQNLKVCYFRYINVWDRIKTFQAVSNAFLMRDGQTFGYYICGTKVYVICVRLRTQPKNSEKLKCKKSMLLVYGKMLVIQFPYMKNTNHWLFMQFSVFMELHEKCMISIFPYMKIVLLAFLVNPGWHFETQWTEKNQFSKCLIFPTFEESDRSIMLEGVLFTIQSNLVYQKCFITKNTYPLKTMTPWVHF